MVAARIPKDLLRSLEDLAKKRTAQSLSAEVKDALEFWVERHANSRPHNSRLASAIAALADYVEEITGKSWIDDSLTRQVLREHIQELVSHTLSPLSEPEAVPADIKEDLWMVLEVLKHSMKRKYDGTVIIDDPKLRVIAQFLGADVETRPALVARRMQQKGRKK